MNPQPKTPMKTAATVDILNDLIQICKDGQDGFRDASENVRHSDLKTLFSQYSLQRSKFAGDLQQHVINLGEDAEKSSSIASALHRGWIDLKSAFTKGSDHAILAECERGEDHAVAAYKDALDQDLPSNIRNEIQEQLAAVQAAHDDICDRRDSTAE
ncbi:MAG TPA: PA2169 family four-helix-bundle protein [Chthoniobacterales bacterium]